MVSIKVTSSPLRDWSPFGNANILQWSKIFFNETAAKKFLQKIFGDKTLKYSQRLEEQNPTEHR